MGSTDLKTVFKNMVRTVATRLSAHGFAQRGVVLHKGVGSNVALIEFQLSDKTSKECVVFTVNLGIVCGELSGAASRRASVMDAHLRQRLGFLLPQRADKWWEITAQTNVIALADELSKTLEESALPYLDEYLDSRTLIALWESGKSPGLTAVQRARLLDQLKRAT
jgi:Domain of unknown function (DUF4304)